MSDDQGDNIRSLGAARMEKILDPAAHDPTAALEAAADWIRTMTDKPDHIIVLVGRTTPDGGSMTRYFQAGKYPHHAQQGLVVEGAAMMRESKV